MAEISTLARPYARAAFEHAAEQKCLDSWLESLQLAAGIAQDPRVHDLLTNPELTLEQKLALFASESFDSAFNALLKVMAENDRLLLLPEVARLFADLKKTHEARIDVELTSAVPLDDETKAMYAQRLQQRLGRQVDIHNHIDPSVLGGVIIKAGDFVVDGSLKAKIAKMAETLAS